MDLFTCFFFTLVNTFTIRLFFIDFVEIKKHSSVNSFDIVAEITVHALKNDSGEEVVKKGRGLKNMTYFE